MRRLFMLAGERFGARNTDASFRSVRTSAGNSGRGGMNSRWLLRGTAVAGGLYLIWSNKDDLHAILPPAPKKPPLPNCGHVVEGLPTYTREEVAAHASLEERIWVTFRHGVYDVTDFIAEHPGGDVIENGFGGAIDPYWAMFGVHRSHHVFKLLEQFRIGNVAEADRFSDEELKTLEDVWAREPARPHCNSDRAHTTQPFNCEAPLATLGDSHVTPSVDFYTRNHLPVPLIDANAWELSISGPGVRDPRQSMHTTRAREPPSGKGVGDCECSDDVSEVRTVQLRLADLEALPQAQVTATLMCAGTRRSSAPTPKDDPEVPKEVAGIPWGPGAISTGVFEGPRLRDVLAYVGLQEDPFGWNDDTHSVVGGKGGHLRFEGLDQGAAGVYGSSIPASLVFERGAKLDENYLNEAAMIATDALKKGAGEGGDVAMNRRAPLGKGDLRGCGGVGGSLRPLETDQDGELDRSDANYKSNAPIVCDAAGEPILALRMNGKPLSPDRGAPCRVVAPGVVGARNVKWLHKIAIAPHESEAFWQKKDYRGHGPAGVRAGLPMESAAAIIDTPIQSSVTYPPPDATVEVEMGPVKRDVGDPEGKNDADGEDVSRALRRVVNTKGYAFAGGGRGVQRVEVSADGGKSWTVAELLPTSGPWAWRLWRCAVPLPDGFGAGGGDVGRNDDIKGDDESNKGKDFGGKDKPEGGTGDGKKEDADEKAKRDRDNSNYPAGRDSSREHRQGVATVPLTLTVRAMDGAYNMQPSDRSSVWNPRGVCQNAWATTTVNVAM